MREYVIETDRVRTTITVEEDGASFRVHYVQDKLAGQMLVKGPPQEYSSKGGTSLYCPSCRAIRKCEAGEPSLLSGKSGRNWRKIDHSDIQWFRRVRVCRTCFYHFVTAEIQEAFLDELVHLRADIVNGKTISAENLAEYGPNIIPFPHR